MVKAQKTGSSGQEVCDCKQLLEEGGIPYEVVRPTGKSSTSNGGGNGEGAVTRKRGNHRRGGSHNDNENSRDEPEREKQSHRQLLKASGVAHVHPAKDPGTMLGPAATNAAWPAARYRPLWFKALQHAQTHGHTHLVVLLSSTLVPSAVVSQLAAAAQNTGGGVMPTFDAGAFPLHPGRGALSEQSDDEAKSLQVWVGAHPAEARATAMAAGDDTDHLRAFMHHPLNYQRAASAIGAAQKAASAVAAPSEGDHHSHSHSHHGHKHQTSALFGQPRRIEDPSESGNAEGNKQNSGSHGSSSSSTPSAHFCTHAQFMTLAAAMPVEAWALLESRPGELWLDDCAVLYRALHAPPSSQAKHAAAAAAAAAAAMASASNDPIGGGGSSLGGLGGLWVHHGAYLVARPPYRAVSLLLQRGFGTALGLTSGKDQGNGGATPEASSILQPMPRRSDTLVAITCAGVWPRTFSALLSLEATSAYHEGGHRGNGGSRRRRLSVHEDGSSDQSTGNAAFDLMLAVTPRGDDASAEAVGSAGIPSITQEVVKEGESQGTKGLTDLWNSVVKHCLQEGYVHCFIVNNDVLIGSGTVSVMVSALESRSADLVLPLTRRGAGTGDLEQYGGSGNSDAFVDSPLSFQRLQLGLLPKHLSHHSSVAGGHKQNNERRTTALNDSAIKQRQRRRQLRNSKIQDDAQHEKAHFAARPAKGWMAFFFGMNAAWARASLLNDNSGRLWNDTRWKNYAQEKNLPPTTRIVAARQAFAYHFRGGTLDSASCKNGWLDCAVWQVNHRPDMASEWFKPNEHGL